MFVCRLRTARDKEAAAETEELMLEIYSAAVSNFTSVDRTTDNPTDVIAADILATADPSILADFRPVAVEADGNCAYRAVSLGLYGTQAAHMYLRLITAIELLKHRAYYDRESRLLKDTVGDDRIYHPTYRSIVQDCLRPGRYAELVHMYALSAACAKPIQSYCAAGVHGLDVHPYTRVIRGRNVGDDTSAAFQIMWSCLEFKGELESIIPNHVVYLERRQNSNSVPLPGELRTTEDTAMVDEVNF
jgi:hypothetical protein